jgi:hypothetical protein
VAVFADKHYMESRRDNRKARKSSTAGLILFLFGASVFLASCQMDDSPARNHLKTSNRAADLPDNAEPNSDTQRNEPPFIEQTQIVEGNCTNNFFTSDLTKPALNQIFQRDRDNSGKIHVQITMTPDLPNGFIQARITPIPGSSGGSWVNLPGTPNAGKPFSSYLQVTPGLYKLDVRFVRSNLEACPPVTVSAVGVGEVFITAGQSNSTNAGKTPMKTISGKVFSTNLTSWNAANDPQPIATATGGSPWPILGDLLANYYNMPIGFISIGWGATHVALWMPGGGGQTGFGSFAPNQLFSRFESALNYLGPSGARAILWHQGESDTLLGTSRQAYAASLRQIIAKTRETAGYEISWYIARVSYFGKDLERQKCPTSNVLCVLDLYKMTYAQEDVIREGIPQVFQGAATDNMTGSTYRYDDVHFNETGLREHAKRWFESLKASIPK